MIGDDLQGLHRAGMFEKKIDEIMIILQKTVKSPEKHFEMEFHFKMFLKRKLSWSNFFGKMPLFFRYSGVNAANAVNLLAKRR